MYDTFGGRYASRLRSNGLDTAVVQTSGSLDNLQLLLGGKVDVAFAQGGTYSLVPDPAGRLRGIAAVYREPLWIYDWRLHVAFVQAQATTRLTAMEAGRDR